MVRVGEGEVLGGDVAGQLAQRHDLSPAIPIPINHEIKTMAAMTCGAEGLQPQLGEELRQVWGLEEFSGERVSRLRLFQVYGGGFRCSNPHPQRPSLLNPKP